MTIVAVARAATARVSVASGTEMMLFACAKGGLSRRIEVRRSPARCGHRALPRLRADAGQSLEPTSQMGLIDKPAGGRNRRQRKATVQQHVFRLDDLVLERPAMRRQARGLFEFPCEMTRRQPACAAQRHECDLVMIANRQHGLRELQMGGGEPTANSTQHARRVRAATAVEHIGVNGARSEFKEQRGRRTCVSVVKIIALRGLYLNGDERRMWDDSGGSLDHDAVRFFSSG